ncbi:HAD family hydrolase [Anaerosporobacter sp.]
MKKAIFFDIDGTLINCMNNQHTMSDKVKEAIKTLRAQGHYTFIASGRPFAFIDENLKSFGFDGFILANGAHIMINDSTIYESPFDDNFYRRMLDEFNNRDIQYILESSEYSYIPEQSTEFYEFYKEIGIPTSYMKRTLPSDDIGILKIEALCPNGDIAKQCLDIIDSYEEYGSFKSIDPRLFEIYNRKNTKATAILKTLEYLNIPIECSYAFGDGENDIEMLSTVGCGIAMDNATDYVKSFAKKITDSVTEDGVANGIMKYVIE